MIAFDCKRVGKSVGVEWRQSKFGDGFWLDVLCARPFQEDSIPKDKILHGQNNGCTIRSERISISWKRTANSVTTKAVQFDCNQEHQDGLDHASSIL
jgi:hypothetical protein